LVEKAFITSVQRLRNNMKIWVDADACPNIIKDILYRAAVRTKTLVVLVANQALVTPMSPFIKRMQVGAGFDVADAKIVESMVANDLVITADIPLASLVIEKGGLALNPRGTLYLANNMQYYLALRNNNEALRESGLVSSGPNKLTHKDSESFANQLDKLLARSVR
jgi:uncharacterized protein YaiI (UPF0178 family)